MKKTEKADQSILLHVCCAPCLATALTTLAAPAQGDPPPIAGAFFYNPNIHPLLEFRRRVKALRLYLEREGLPAEIDDEYGLPRFLETVNWRGGRRERCAGCYAMRLGKTAERAKALGLEGFTTTLLASREQDGDCVREVGEQVAKRCGVRFFTADLRRLLPDEKRLRGIYKQQYCGCVFSEEERYRDTGKHLYRPGGTRDHEE